MPELPPPLAQSETSQGHEQLIEAQDPPPPPTLDSAVADYAVEQPPATSPPQSAEPDPGVQLRELIETLRGAVASAGRWFFWIAGLSLINFFILIAQSPEKIENGTVTHFMLGLSITDFIAFFAVGSGNAAKLVASLIAAIPAGLFILFGVFAVKRKNWAFIVGMVLYILDALLYLAMQDWRSVAFHGIALYFLFRGLRLNNQLRHLEVKAEAHAMMPDL